MGGLIWLGKWVDGRMLELILASGWVDGRTDLGRWVDELIVKVDGW